MATLSRFQEHSDSRHLSHHIDIGNFVQVRRLLRGGMRFEQQASGNPAAPANPVSIAMLEEINRPVEFARPAIGSYFSAILVDQDQRTRMKNRIHRPIGEADQPVMKVSLLDAGQESQGHFPPSADQMIQ